MHEYPVAFSHIFYLLLNLSLSFFVSEPSSVLPITMKVVTEGSNLTMMCNASGIPPPTVIWVKTSNEERTNETNLVFTNIHRNQSGEYACKANNPCGDATHSVEIDVQCKQFVKRLFWVFLKLLFFCSLENFTSFISSAFCVHKGHNE